MDVDNVVKDISRSIARIDRYGATKDESRISNIDGTNWTVLDMRMSVASDIGFVIGHTVRSSKVSKRDVSLMLASHGMSGQGISLHARAIARMIRSDFGMHRWSGSI